MVQRGFPWRLTHRRSGLAPPVLSGGTVAGIADFPNLFTLLGSEGFVSGTVLAIRDSGAARE